MHGTRHLLSTKITPSQIYAHASKIVLRRPHCAGELEKKLGAWFRRKGGGDQEVVRDVSKQVCGDDITILIHLNALSVLS